MIRVGFVITANKASWLGGINYLRTLLTAVTRFGSGDIEPVLFVGHHFDPAARRLLPKVETHETSVLDPRRPGWILRGASIVLSRNDIPTVWLLRRHGIDVISHSGPLGRHPGFPSVSWIPDFQHVHLPEFFSPRELRSRDRQFHRLCDESERVIVSSEAALGDLVTFHTAVAAKARVLHFVVEPPVETGASRDELMARYGLESPFLHLPNQLWAHKNHRVVVEALGFLAREDVNVTIAATGAAEDYRRPGLHAELVGQVREHGVEGRFRLLGRVPYRDVVGLMRASDAVLNPSLFEGWSTTVEEAKSLGKRVVLSDIPVHREQAPAGAVYFPPRNPKALADVLRGVLSDRDAGGEMRRAERAKALMPMRRRDFALGYERIVRDALGAR